MTVNAKEYNLPANLYDYRDDIRLRLTYSLEDYKVSGCKVINYQTGKIIEDLSEENINKLFNIEYGKNINEKEWVETLKLSDLKENEIYKYTAGSTLEFPEIQNDTGKNCMIYLKEWYDDTYEQEINMYDSISSASITFSSNEYNLGDTFYIMYREIKTDELLKRIEEDDIIYLSNYKDGEKLEYSFEKYIYNNTQNNITVNIVDSAFSIEKSDSIMIEKGKIYEFDWMIDTATITINN